VNVAFKVQGLVLHRKSEGDGGLILSWAVFADVCSWLIYAL
jgi:hypothetical protein